MDSKHKKSLKYSSHLLQDGEERYKLLVESVHDYAIFMLDEQGIISTWNIGAERIKGYKAEEIIGRHFSIFYTQQAREEAFPQYELVQAKKEGRFEDEGWRVKKDGSTFWANVIITPVYKEGQHIGFSKVTRDLSERVKNEALMKKNRELLRINTDLDNFVYMASHDLKSPIANLEGLLKILDQDPNARATASQEKILKLMNTSVQSLRQTVADLTEITKIQKDIKENVVEVSFPEVMQEVKHNIEQLMLEAQATIQAHFHVPELLFNKAALKSILYNLLSNAIKYRSSDRPIQIEVTSYMAKDHVVLSVKDNGLGLKKEQQAKLFTMFKRFHQHVEGTGIGLYIIKRAIENTGGWIEVDSRENQGSEFRVHFRVIP